MVAAADGPNAASVTCEATSPELIHPRARCPGPPPAARLGSSWTLDHDAKLLGGIRHSTVVGDDCP